MGIYLSAPTSSEPDTQKPVAGVHLPLPPPSERLSSQVGEPLRSFDTNHLQTAEVVVPELVPEERDGLASGSSRTENGKVYHLDDIKHVTEVNVKSLVEVAHSPTK